MENIIDFFLFQKSAYPLLALYGYIVERAFQLSSDLIYQNPATKVKNVFRHRVSPCNSGGPPSNGNKLCCFGAL